MGMCLDVASCSFENREKARFCARCGIPLRGTFLLGRYEIHELVSKDRGTATLHAIDRHTELLVTVRALIPEVTNDKEREEFLQDAELAKSLSSRINEAGSIRVTDFGQDGPVVFLVKSEFTGRQEPARPRIIARVEGHL